jgi:hypothetical protein
MALGKIISLFVALWVCTTVEAAIRYVDANSSTPMSPYTNWATAAVVIQDAVDVSAAGDSVLVTNGVYAGGGRQLNPYDVTNRVTITNSVVVQSVNGSAYTFIQGYRPPSSSLTNAIRCAYLGSNSVLSGFTLTNGSAGSGNYVNGGAVESFHGSGAVVSNCVLVGNFAAGAGGGGSYGTYIGCIFRANFGQGGGAAADATLINCVITNNSAGWAAAMLSGNATNCVMAFNHATNYGGACGYATLVNCTVVSNSLQAGLGGNGGGCYYGAAYNSIIYGNSAPNGPNYLSSGLGWCCTLPQAGGTGNFTNAPALVSPGSGDFHLQSNSPCINAGANSVSTAAADLDGNPRIRGGTVDVGAYEFQNPTSAIAYYWLQNFNLSTDGSADLQDTDGDGATNWQEWRAGTDPRNASSVLKLMAPGGSNGTVTVTWQSVSGILYYLERGTDLAPANLLSIKSNLVGQAGTTSYTDTNAASLGPYFYRVGVQ